MTAYEVVREDGTREPETDALGLWRDRLQEAENDRRKYEADWQIARLFLQGSQWIGVAGQGRDARVVTLPNPQNRQRHTVNVITQYFWTLVGKLTADGIDPELSFARDDREAQAVAGHSQKTVRYVLEEEVDADSRQLEVVMRTVQYGTCVVRSRWDTTIGRVLGEVPVGPDGQPVVDPAEAQAIVAGAVESGERAQFVTAREGGPRWDVFSPDGIFPPPGVSNPEKMPWLILGMPVSLHDVNAAFPGVAKGLTEENLATVDTVGIVDLDSGSAAGGGLGKLRGHVMLYTGYEKPTEQYPEGRVVHFTKERFLREVPRLPYQRRGESEFGVAWFFYHRVADRLWGIGAVQQGVGPQYQRNVARSQMIEAKDRMGLGRVFAPKGSIEASDLPIGQIGEVVWYKPGLNPPQETPGTPVGQWLADEVAMNDADLDKAMGMRDVSLGAAPGGVSAYSAMALLAEQDDKRLGPILKAARVSWRQLVQWSLQDVRRLWPPDKHMAVAGEDNTLETFTYGHAPLPAEFYVSIGVGPAQPKSMAAEIQKAFDLFDRSIATGRPLPLDWLKDSIEAGKCLPLPDDQADAHRGKAELENQLMQRGQLVQPMLYDDDQTHLQIHKIEAAQLALVPEMAQLLPLYQLHIQAHEIQQQLKLAAMQKGMASGIQVAGPQGGAGAGPQAGGQMQAGQAAALPSPIAPS